MRILFICGCLEPGKDGVGDYTQTLAKELVSMGVKVSLVALNDQFITEDNENHLEVSSLRLSTGIEWGHKVKQVKKWIDSFKPDHIVWQFVIYAFHPRGITFMPIYHVTQLLKSYPQVSIMFHEIWVGAAREDKLIDKLTGKIQRLIIKWLFHQLCFKITLTSNHTYCSLLRDSGINCKLLPLFSNVPFISGAEQKFKEHLKQQKIVLPDNTLKIGLFGRIPKSWQLQNFVNRVKHYSLDQNLAIFVAGRSDQMSAEELENILKAKLPNIRFINIGEQPVNIISGFLQYMNFGIATNSPQTIGKSGVFAAYREHGLPVIMGGLNKKYNHIGTSRCEQIEDLIIEIDNQLIENLKSFDRLSAKDTRSEIAFKFLQLLQNHQRTEILS